MQIETYEIEEIKNSEASTMAADAEAIELITKLGLDGQQKLIDPITATRFPYPALSKVQKLIYSTNFPVAEEVTKFSNEIIPLRVLQVIAFCRDFEQTRHMEIWHTGVAQKDPVLIGRKERYSGVVYILARWGNALESFESLTQKAEPILRVKYQARLAKLRNGVTTIEAELDSNLQEALLTGNEPSFSVYA